MIRYSLKCSGGHAFESWFRSGGAFEALREAGQLECPQCGDTAIDKAPMAPQVATRASVPAAQDDQRAALRRHVEANSDYVGERFAAEARRIHAGESDARMIHGEARPAEAKALIEEGVPIAPLPFMPRRRTH